MKGAGKARIIGGLCAVACAVLLACSVVAPMQILAPDGGAQSSSVAGATAQQLPADAADTGSADDAEGAADAVGNAADETASYDDNTVLVSIPAGVSPDQAVAAIAEETGLDGLALSDGGGVEPASEDDGSVLVELALPVGVRVEDAVDLIDMTSIANDAQPNFFYYIQDSDAQQQSKAGHAGELVLTAQGTLASGLVAQALSVDDPDVGTQWALKSINAYKGKNGNAWDKQKTDNSVAVAVIDEGFEVGHPDLKPNVKLTYNATNGSSNVAESANQNGHGTHVAGIVAARANNGMGVAGVSYNANLVLIKIMDSAGGIDTSNVVKAIDYVIKNKTAYNIRVINMSIGAKWPSYDDPSSTDKAVMKAIDRAVDNGIVVVCSAGNKDEGRGWEVPYVNYPGDYSNVVSVINLEQRGTSVARSPRSNYNLPGSATLALPDGKNISAPGTEIYSTMPGSKYGMQSGTSMAAPHVSAALALAFAKKPNMSARDATSLLYSTATDIGSPGWDRETGHGEVNVYAMVNGGGYLKGATSVKVGKSIALTPSANTSGSWTWKTSNAKIATVSGGKVTGVGAGMAHISAVGKIGDRQVTLRKDVRVYGTSIANAKVSLSRPSFTYTGMVQRPRVASVVVGGKKLTAGVDYKVTYSSGCREVGSYVVKVTGIGRYCGMVKAKFTIRHAPGWDKEYGVWHYYTSKGTLATGWQKVGGVWYWLGSDGDMRTGWQKVSGTWYWLGSDGAMRTGWQKLSGKWYWLKSSGAMATGWQKVGGVWYLLGSDGAMRTGWQKVSGTWYWLKSSGAMATGWQNIGGTWYWFNSSGAWVS